jgi:hypothetical protein
MFRSEEAPTNRRVTFVVAYHHLMPANRKQARQPTYDQGGELVIYDELDDGSNHSVELLTIFVAFFVLI